MRKHDGCAHRVVAERRVDGWSQEPRDFRCHAVLVLQHGVRKPVVDEALKHRDVEVVLHLQLVRLDVGAQLVVVAAGHTSTGDVAKWSARVAGRGTVTTKPQLRTR